MITGLIDWGDIELNLTNSVDDELLNSTYDYYFLGVVGTQFFAITNAVKRAIRSDYEKASHITKPHRRKKQPL